MKTVLFLLLCVLGTILQSPQPAAADTWAIYWYVCGSDLEQRHGSATDDIVELANASFSDNVTVVLQTGGTKAWEPLRLGNKKLQISNKHIERYVFAKDTVKRVEQLPQANMGQAKTLTQFLRFCLKNYPADHKVLILWDHGGGSASDFANDQNYSMQGMNLQQFRSSLAEVFGEHPKTPPLDIIGFDACLMATLDTAVHAHGFAKYLIASEEVESGLGWYYTEPISKLSKNSRMSPADFGKIICDSFLADTLRAKSDEYDPSYEATLSVIDLEQVPLLKIIWDLLGMEALAAFSEDDTIVSHLGRKAKATENFANSKRQGFSNMMDMGCFLMNIRPQYKDTVDMALEQLKDTVVYNVSGAKHTSAMGISCYYPFDGAEKESYRAMLSKHSLSSFVLLQGLQFNRLTSKQADQYFKQISDRLEEFLGEDEKTETNSISTIVDLFSVSAQAAGKTKPMNKLDISSLEDWKIEISPKGDAVLNIGAEKCSYLDNVAFYLALVDLEDQFMILLGSDADMYSDWEKGVFTSHFRNRWAQINDNLVTLELTGRDQKGFIYDVPVKLNGERVVIRARYDLEKSAYTITGAHRILSNGLPDKFLIKLKPGDRISTIFYASNMDDDSEFQEIEIDTFTIGKKLVMEDTDLGDCQLAYMFEMNDVQGNSALSDVALITVEDGKITIE